jgi:hypothetical protein
VTSTNVAPRVGGRKSFGHEPATALAQARLRIAAARHGGRYDGAPKPQKRQGFAHSGAMFAELAKACQRLISM